MATFYQMQRYDARSNIAEFACTPVGEVVPVAAAGLVGLPVNFQWEDGKRVGEVVATDFDSCTNSAVVKAKIHDEATRRLLAEGCLTGVSILPDNSIVVRDVPVDKAATFEYVDFPARLCKALRPNQAAVSDPFRFGNASKSPYLSYWDRQHPTPEVSKRAAAPPRKHDSKPPATTGYPVSVPHDLTFDYELAKVAGALRVALRQAARTSGIPGFSREDIAREAGKLRATLTKTSNVAVARPTVPDKNRLAYQNANRRRIEGEVEPSYIAADAVGRGVAKAWSDEARAAASLARKHNWQLHHTGNTFAALRHPDLPGHEIVYHADSTWQHTLPGSNNLFPRVKASGQGVKSLEQHLHEYHDIVPRSQRGGSGPTGPANPYHHEKE